MQSAEVMACNFTKAVHVLSDRTLKGIRVERKALSSSVILDVK